MLERPFPARVGEATAARTSWRRQARGVTGKRPWKEFALHYSVTRRSMSTAPR